jgi:hypothetical protein
LPELFLCLKPIKAHREPERKFSEALIEVYRGPLGGIELRAERGTSHTTLNNFSGNVYVKHTERLIYRQSYACAFSRTTAYAEGTIKERGDYT